MVDDMVGVDLEEDKQTTKIKKEVGVLDIFIYFSEFSVVF